MNSQMYSEKHIANSKSQLEKMQNKLWENLKNAFNEEEDTTIWEEELSPDFLDQLQAIISVDDVDFTKYSSVKWHFLSMANDVLEIAMAQAEMKAMLADENASDDEVAAVLVWLMSIWENTPYAEYFESESEASENPLEISEESISLLENNVLAFYVLNLNELDQKFEQPLLYHAVLDWGDNWKEICIGESAKKISMQKLSEDFPILKLTDFNPSAFKIEFSDESFSIKSDTNKAGKIFLCDCRCDDKRENWSGFPDMLDQALSFIKSNYPQAASYLDQFVERIAIVDEMVDSQTNLEAKSMVSMPGVILLSNKSLQNVNVLTKELLASLSQMYLLTTLLCEEEVSEELTELLSQKWLIEYEVSSWENKLKSNEWKNNHNNNNNNNNDEVVGFLNLELKLKSLQAKISTSDEVALKQMGMDRVLKLATQLSKNIMAGLNLVPPGV